MQWKADRLSARVRHNLTFGISFLALLAAPVVAWEAPIPESPNATTAPAPPAPVDEAAAAVQENHTDGIAAIVNDTVISNYDVRQRVSLFMATSGIRQTPEALKQIRAQVLKQLETERLELLEAEKSKVSVSAAEVDKAIDDIKKDNHLSTEQLQTILSQADVQMATLRAQIAAQIAWSKLVQDSLGDRVHVSPLDVKEELARLQAGADLPRYAVSEIFQAVDTPEQDAKVHKDMDDLEVQLQSGAPFSAVARQLSQNPTAAQGGDLGIVQESQLPPELGAVLKTLHPGQISPPIRASGGYYILLLREKEEGANAKIADVAPEPTGPAGTLPLVRITLPIGTNPPKDLVERAFQAAAVMRSHIGSCATAKEVVSHLPGAVYNNLGDMRLADLSPQMQAAINQAEPGSATAPMQSPAGVEVFVRCDKPVQKIVQYRVPKSDEIEQQIYQEQITTLARQYLRDLRRDADVETK
jgi:peptidyl-prolyl cis-trans isomerase SurA